MLLHHRLIDLEIRRPNIFVSHADQRDAREVVIRFHHQGALNIEPCRRQRTRRNFHALPAPQLSNRLQNFRLGKVWHKLKLFPLMHDVVAARRRTHTRFVQSQPLAVFQKSRL